MIFNNVSYRFFKQGFKNIQFLSAKQKQLLDLREYKESWPSIRNNGATKISKKDTTVYSQGVLGLDIICTYVPRNP